MDLAGVCSVRTIDPTGYRQQYDLDGDSTLEHVFGALTGCTITAVWRDGVNCRRPDLGEAILEVEYHREEV